MLCLIPRLTQSHWCRTVLAKTGVRCVRIFEYDVHLQSCFKNANIANTDVCKNCSRKVHSIRKVFSSVYSCQMCQILQPTVSPSCAVAAPSSPPSHPITSPFLSNFSTSHMASTSRKSRLAAAITSGAQPNRTFSGVFYVFCRTITTTQTHPPSP